jgi:hypothetical protein
MSESRAQRTLVKSPPELWAEVSDVAALARHLSELDGEIRITRMKPETTIVWEGRRARGRVELTPSGWGTTVTLTVSQDAEPAPAQPVVLAPVPPAPEPPEADVAPDVPAPAPPEAQVAPDPPAAEPPEEHVAPAAPPLSAAAARLRLFARLFIRARRDHGVVEPSVAAFMAAAIADAGALAEEPVVAAGPAVTEDPGGRPPPDGATRATELLNSVLDALGAAHHRPFSRS